jgi:hypothetical protein
MIRRIKLVQFGAVSLVAVRILCCPGILMAQESNTDPEPRIVEPIITEETMPNEPGEWDLRLSGSYMWQGPGGFGLFPRAQLFFGIAKRWGGEVEARIAKETANHYGVGDISTTMKYLVLEPGVRSPGVVLGLETTFPSGNAPRGLGEGVLEAAPFVAAVYASRSAVLQGNFGYAVVHRISGTDASNQFFYNGAVAFPIERLNAFLLGEINGTHASGGNQVAFSPGLKYNLTPERYLAIAFPVGLNQQSPRLGIVLQIQIALRGAKTK